MAPERYTTEQTERIRAGVAEARRTLQAAGTYDPLSFARAFVAAGGIQIPGRADGDAARLGAALLKALAEGVPTTEDRDLARELARARAEARWAEAENDDRIVGFRLELPWATRLDHDCAELLKEDRGLGAAVFRKAEVVVLPAECSEGARFIPVAEHEVEQ